MLKKVQTTSLVAATLTALALSAGASKAAAQQIAVNTDLKPNALSSVQIIDQRSAEVYDDNTPVLDDNGNPVFDHSTSLNVDAFFTAGDFQTDLNDGIANNGLLFVGIEGAGFCQNINNPSANAAMPARGGVYRIPEPQIRKSRGLFNNTYLFEGSLNLQQILQAEARLAGFDWANMILTVGNGPLAVGELKVDGATDVSGVLSTPQQKVDLIIAWGETANDSDDPPAPSPAPALKSLQRPTELGCVTITPKVVVVPLPNNDVGPAPSK